MATRRVRHGVWGVLAMLMAALPVGCPAQLQGAAQTKSAAQPASEGPSATPLVLWYRQPAAQWNAALPVGNGHLGAMVFGGANSGSNNGDSQVAAVNAGIAGGHLTRAQDEHLQLNEDTVWEGRRADRLNPAAGAAFPEIRKLLLAGKVAEAEKLAAATFLSTPKGMPGYETLGDLYVRSKNDAPVEAYRRELDLNTGVARASYVQAGARFTREVFASAPDHVLVVNLGSNRPGLMNVRVEMDRPGNFMVRTEGNDRLLLLPGQDDPDQIQFAGELLVLPRGGAVRADGNGLEVEGADGVTLLFAAATDFRGGPFAGGDPRAACEAMLAAARVKDVAAMQAASAAEIHSYMQRAWLQLGSVNDPLLEVPTDERLQRAVAGMPDLHLEMLYFQLGRYLLLESSRPGGMPANLQGLWASGLSNPWGSKYTVNVNTEMNYWAAEPTALGETTQPLFDLIDMARTPATGTATQVARQYYGAGGFVIHHNTDIWGDANPIDGVAYGIWPMGGAWLSLSLWEHYAFTQDKAFLAQRAYPVLKQASEFFVDYLTGDGHGHLVTGPSLSPENQYKLPDGTQHSLAMGPTMDIEITRELLTRTLQASTILGVDPEFRAKVAADIALLPPFKIGRLGNLQEWQEDYEEAAPGHRHISHLWALYPARQISPEETPDLAQAARVTLQRRLDNGGGQTGWSRAWVINYWDRLHEGNRAYESLQVLLKQSTFVNLLDDHPPGVFQIDGNEGAVAGMVGMVLDSRFEPQTKKGQPGPQFASEIDFLPALPAAWPDGWFEGFKARGGETVSLGWANGYALTATVQPAVDGLIQLRAPAGQEVRSVVLDAKAVKVRRSGGLAGFQAVAGQRYVVLFR